MSIPPSQPPISPGITLRIEAARRLGYVAEGLDAETGYLFELRRGAERALLLGGFSPLNNAVASRLAEDKFHTALLLERAGFRVPRVVRCLRPGRFEEEDFSCHEGIAAAEKLAEELGFPLIVKPNRGARGRGVQSVESLEEMRAAIEQIWRDDYLALVQERIVGIDVRLDFLRDGELRGVDKDDAYLIGYVRRPVRLVGDGRRSVRELLAARDPRFTGAAFWEHLARDPIWRRVAAPRDLEFDSIPAHGEVLDFSTDILNLNRLCTAEIVRDLPPAWLERCLAAGDALGMRHWGIDFKLAHLDGPLAEVDPADAVVLEINSSPSVVQMSRLGYFDDALAAETRLLRALFA